MICGFIENLPFNVCLIFWGTRKNFWSREIFQVVLKTEKVTRAEKLMLGVDSELVDLSENVSTR